MANPGTRRIFWRPREHEDVAREALKLNGSMPRDEIWADAQILAGIAPERRREFPDAAWLAKVLGPAETKVRVRKVPPLGSTPPTEAPPDSAITAPATPSALASTPSMPSNGLSQERTDDSAGTTPREQAERFFVTPPAAEVAAPINNAPHSVADELPEQSAAEAPPTTDELRLMATGSAVRLLVNTFADAFKSALVGTITDPRVVAVLMQMRSGVPLAEGVAPPPPVEPEARPPPSTHEPLEDDPPQPQPSNQVRTRLPRILVAGIKPNHIESVRQQFAGRAQFIFFKIGETNEQLRRMVQGADHAIGLVPQLGHTGEQILKSRCPSYHPAHGAGSMMSQIDKALKIEELERGKTSPAPSL